MPGENIGGLDYEINIKGNFDAKLTEFEKRVNALQKKSAAVDKGTSKTGASSRADKIIVKDAQRTNALLTKEADKKAKADSDRTKSAIRDSVRASNDEKKLFQDRAKAQIADEGRQERSRKAARKLTRDQAKDEKKLFEDRAKAQLGFEKQQERSRQVAQRAADTEAKALKSTKEGLAKQRQAEDIGFQARQRNIASARELKVKQAQINDLVKQHGISQRAAADQVGVTSAQAKQLKLNMFDAQHAARQFLFTFRRLVGILAIFTLARQLAQNIGLAVKEMSRFNAEIELAEISIASIVSSVGQVRDGQGQLVTGADAFAKALQASQQIMAQLKKDAIGSIATFEALAKAYQVAIGPGLAAGLDLDQVRVLSKRLAEGAISLGVPLNQLSEEIRSLLQGTATARNTRIAVLFGGAKEANEAVRNAKEQGNLYEVLLSKLQGVKQGADAAGQSFEVLSSNLQDSIQLLLAEGGIEHFDQLKESILGLTQAITTVDATGDIGFTPEALGVVQEVGSTLAGIVSSFREISDTGQSFVFLRNLLASVGDVLKVLAPLASAVFQGLVTGANLALAPVRLLADVLRVISRALGLQNLNKGLAQVVKFALAGLTAFVIWQKLFVSFPLLVAKLLTGLSLIGSKFIQIALSQALVQAQMLGIVVGTTAWDVLLVGVVVKMALITGGITVVLGLLALVVTKTKVFERLIGNVNNDLKSGESAAEGFAGAIESAGDATAEGAKSAKEWATALRDAQKATRIEQAMAGLTGETEKLVKLLVQESAEFDDQARSLVKSIDASKERKKLLEEELKTATTLSDVSKDAVFNITGFGVPDDVGKDLAKEAQDILDSVASNVSVNITDTFSGAFESAADDVSRLQSQIAIENQRILETEDDLAASRAKSLEILKEQIKQFTAQNTLINQQQQVAIAENAAKALKASTDRSNVSAKAVAQAQAELTTLQATANLERQRRSLAVRALEQQITDAKTLVGTEATVLVLQEQLTRERELSASASKVETAQLKAQNVELDRRTKLLAGNIGDALSIGLEDFTRELPALGEQIAETITGALSDLAGVVGATFQDAIDPRSGFNSEALATAFGEFFLDLAGTFVEAITSQLIASALTTVGLGAAEDVATIANTTAVTANTGALGAMSIAMGVLTTAVNANTIASRVGGAGGILTAAGGGIVPRHFASGGDVGALPRPSSIPASDTVPAWLTPGEFVIKRDAVRKLGIGTLHALNNGVLNPKSFSATGLALGGMVRGAQSFAHGGTVQRSTPNQSGQTTKTIIQPVLVASEENMEGFISGGRKEFNSNVDKVDRVGDPNRTRSW